MSAQFEEEVIVSHIINRDNAGIGVTRNIGRSIPKTPPPLWAVTELDRRERTMAQQGRPKLPRLRTGRSPD